jgi:hemerythrin-like domain-containing protein
VQTVPFGHDGCNHQEKDEEMTSETLSAALEREHREIDGGIEEYAAGLGAGAADPGPLLRAMAGLRRHIYLEEEFIFPPLKEAGMMMPVFVMLREHGELWDAMSGLDDLLTADVDPGAIQDACRELLTRLDAHNSKEEPIIYPQADAQLSDDTTSRLHDFLAEGRMPDGWRCEQATR